MPEFTQHSLQSAPEASRPLLQQTEQNLGFVPNLLAAMAQSPATLEAYLTLTRLFDKTGFSVTERQLVLLSISRHRNCCYCLAAHGTVAQMQRIPKKIVNAIYYQQPLDDDKLEALRRFTQAVLKAEGWVKPEDLQRFYQAGYTKRHVLEVILGVSFKTLSNYVNHINDTPIDEMFLQGLPENKPCDTA